MNLKLFTFTNYLYSASYYTGPVASAGGATDEGAGCSLPGGTMFGSIRAEVAFPPKPGSVLFAGSEASSPRVLRAMS